MRGYVSNNTKVGVQVVMIATRLILMIPILPSQIMMDISTAQKIYK